MRLFAVLANSTYHHLYLLLLKTYRQLYIRNIYIIQANGSAAIFTEKMNMIIVVMPFGTVVLTQCITDRVIRSWDSMNDAFLQERMQCSINSYAIELLTGFFLNVTVGKRTIMCKEQLQNSFSARCYTKLVTLQYVRNLPVHIMITLENYRLLERMCLSCFTFL